MSYSDAVAFCEWLSRKEGKNYRLPTEAEWEYACRAGTYTLFSTGDGLPAVYHRNQKVVRDFDPVSLKVAQTPPNTFGLYDMHGNVEEWCLDWYAPYSAEKQKDPAGPLTGEFRVTRGGSHHTPEKYLRSANRLAMLPEDKHSQTGFRIVEADTRLNVSGTSAPVPFNQKSVENTSIKWKKYLLSHRCFCLRYHLWYVRYVIRIPHFICIIISLQLRGVIMEICWQYGFLQMKRMGEGW